MLHSLSHVGIAALRVAVPSNEIRLEDEVEYYGGSAKKVARLKSILGMDRRRVCPPDVTASDLCAYAALDLLKAYPQAQEADALIFISQSPDWHQPATACELQHRLGLTKNCAALDVNQGCAGYIYGLWLGASLIASGAARQALVLVGDAHSFGREKRNRITTPVFGDAGSATLLVRDENAAPMYFDFGTDGSDFEAIIAPAGCARIPFVHDPDKNNRLVQPNVDSSGNVWHMGETYMDGGAIFSFTMDVVPDHILKVLSSSGYSLEDIDWLILHQANRQIVENIATKTGFPLSKVPSGTFGKYGNAASASIPLTLADNLAGIPNPGKLLLCGYGIGLSWGSCICQPENWYCQHPLEFEADTHRPTREQRIERWERILRGEQNRHDKK